MPALNTTSLEQSESRTVAPPVPPMAEPAKPRIISEMAAQARRIARSTPNQAGDDRRAAYYRAEREASRRDMTSTIGSRRKP
jgi:hypothetical protein